MRNLQNLHLAFTATYKKYEQNTEFREATFHDFKTREAFLANAEHVLGEKLPVTNYEFGRQFAVTITKPQIEKIEEYINKNGIIPSLKHFVKEMQPDNTFSDLLYHVTVDNRGTMKALTEKLERAGIKMLGNWGFNRPVQKTQEDETLENLGLKKSRGDQLLGDTVGENMTAERPAIRLTPASYNLLMERIRDIDRLK